MSAPLVSDPAHLRRLELATLDAVAANGKSPTCSDGCRITTGRKCPPEWCEVIYQQFRRAEQTG